MHYFVEFFATDVYALFEEVQKIYITIQVLFRYNGKVLGLGCHTRSRALTQHCLQQRKDLYSTFVVYICRKF